METRAAYTTKPNEKTMRAEALAWHAEAKQLEAELSELAHTVRRAFVLCDLGRALYLRWCAYLDDKDKPGARAAKSAYYLHRESCPECTHANPAER